MHQDANNNTISTMEAQLHKIVKVVNDVTDAATKEMKKSAQEGFTEVTKKLDSVYNIILQRVLESAAAQEYMLISTEPRARNVQIPPTAIALVGVYLNTSLQQLQTVSLDINRLSTHMLVAMQHMDN